MSLPRGPHRRTSLSLQLASSLLLGCALVLPTVAHAARTSATGDRARLSERLLVLSSTPVRSQPPAQQARSVGLSAEGPASLMRDGTRVVVRLRLDGSAAEPTLRALRASGAQILHVSDPTATVTASVVPADLTAVAGVEGVQAVTETLTPMLFRSTPSAIPPVTSAVGASILTPQSCQGARTSAGDLQLNAARARASYGVDGSGVTVGILSDSFAKATDHPTHDADLRTGDLPGPGNPCGFTTPTDVVADYDRDPQNRNAPYGTDEGRAMAQIVHDLAPGARLAFATAFTSLESFAANIRLLATRGATVLVDDVAYHEEPFFQDGPISNAVSDVTAAGASYFSSAGNNNIIDAQGNDISSWEAPAFREAASCPPAVRPSGATDSGNAASLTCQDFDPGPGNDNQFRIRIAPRSTLQINLQWAQPWRGVTTDLDAFILNAAGNRILDSSTSDNLSAIGGSQRPFEFVRYENPTGAPLEVHLVIGRYVEYKCLLPVPRSRCLITVPFLPPVVGDLLTPRLKFVMANNDAGSVVESEYPRSQGGDIVGPAIFGHNGTSEAVSVAAIDNRVSNRPQPFSSRGPVTHYFTPFSEDTPATPIPARVLQKPDLTASDCGDSTRFGGTFCGTSAAAPHAAAVAALARQAKPTASRTEIRTAMTATATPIGRYLRPGPAVGAGLLDAAGTLSRLAPARPVDTASRPGFSATHAIAAGDPLQTGRVARDNVASGCTAATTRGVTSTNQTFAYDAYRFVNVTNQDQCVRVQIATGPACRAGSGDAENRTGNVFSTTYVPGFDPANVGVSAQGVTGLSPITDSGVAYFVNVPAGSPYTVVVNETEPGRGCAEYALRVDALAPYATARPSIAGAATVGATLTASAGDWNGATEAAFSWRRCTSDGGNCQSIPGAGSATYTPTGDDLGATLSVTVHASHSGKSSSSDSYLTAPIGAALDPWPPNEPPVVPPTPKPPTSKPAAKVARTTITLTGPRSPKRRKLVTYRVVARAHPKTGKATVIAGQKLRLRIDRRRAIVLKTDRKGQVRFRLRFSAGRHRLQLVPSRHRKLPLAKRLTRTVRVR